MAAHLYGRPFVFIAILAKALVPKGEIRLLAAAACSMRLFGFPLRPITKGKPHIL